MVVVTMDYKTNFAFEKTLTPLILKLEYPAQTIFNTLASDALAFSIFGTSAAVAMTLFNKMALIYHFERFQLPVTSAWGKYKLT